MLTLNKKIVIIFFISLLFFNLIVNQSYAIVSKTTDFYVNDSANILSRETENYIIKMNVDLYNKTGAQIVVATVNNLEGKSVEDYALEMFRSYGIGSKDKNNGILFLVSTGERQTRIEVGYGLEGQITDGKAGRILDNYVIPYFKSNDWENGIKNGFNAILEEVEEEYNITIDGATPSQSRGDDSENNILYVSGVIVFIISSLLRSFFSGRFGTRFIAGLGVVGIATFVDTSLNSIIPIGSYLMINSMAMLAGIVGFMSIGGGRLLFWRRIFRRRRLLWWRWLFWRRRKQ
ncbi:MAG: TPM domain-containing protein [Clostridia bacterium]|nr:TPM domain-containing protein [Clostridia bacterium]